MSHPNRLSTGRRFSIRIGLVSAVLLGGVLAACGSDGGGANDTLPPIATTTTTTTMPPTTTTIPDSYVIQPGDTLFSIATMFGLTIDELAIFNNIVNKEHIEAGQRLRIPQAADLATTTTVGVTIAPVDAATSTT